MIPGQKNCSPQGDRYHCVEAQIPDPYRELFVELLWELGTLGVEEMGDPEHGRILAYFETGSSLEELRFRVEAGLLDLGCGAAAVRFYRLRYDSDEWLARYNATFVGFEVTPSIWVHPPWDAASDRHPINILLEPGHGFGTGSHESTQLAMEAIASCVDDCASFLDYGTGSGILTVTAVKLNPRLNAVAFDIDPLATSAALGTFHLNGLDQPLLFAGEGRSLRRRFDLVAANLTAPLIFDVAAELERLCGRLLIAAGFTASEIEFVSSVLLQHGTFRERQSVVRNDWASLVLERCAG